jgi:hypothetical protein
MARKLSDYDAALYNRSIETLGGAGQSGPGGPLSVPITAGTGQMSSVQILAKIAELLYGLPDRIQQSELAEFLRMPRAGSFWVRSTPSVALAGGGTTPLVSFTMPNRHAGALKFVGLAASPAGSLPFITWDLRFGVGVAQQRHPEFTGQIFSANQINPPLPFEMELVQSRTIQLQATNTDVNPINVEGIMIGWRHFLQDNMPFGDSPRGGIG